MEFSKRKKIEDRKKWVAMKSEEIKGGDFSLGWSRIDVHESFSVSFKTEKEEIMISFTKEEAQRIVNSFNEKL